MKCVRMCTSLVLLACVCVWGLLTWHDTICWLSFLQVAAITALTLGLLALPLDAGLLTPEQRAQYLAFSAILPPLPLAAGGLNYAPAEVVSSGSHNAEVCRPCFCAFSLFIMRYPSLVQVPELYGAHPFRLLSVGRSFVDPTVNLTIGVATWNALPLAKTNTGW